MAVRFIGGGNRGTWRKPPENCENRNDPDLVQAFLRNGRLNQILMRQTSPFHYGSKFPAVTITVFITKLEQNIVDC